MLAIAFVLGAKQLDLFSIEHGMMQGIHSSLGRMAGALYPWQACVLGCPDTPTVPGRDRVAVVLYDEPSLEARASQDGGARWPLPTKSHALLLDGLVEAEAAVVVFDMVINEDRDGGAADFAIAIVAARRAGTRVVLAQLPNGSMTECPGGGTRPGGALLPTLACAADEVAAYSWRTPLPGLYYPRSVGEHGHALMGTLATAAHHALVPGAAAESDADLLVAWGLPQVAKQSHGEHGADAHAGGGAACARTPGEGRGLAEHAGLVMAALLNSADDPAECRYHDTWPASDVWNADTGARAVLRERLRGRAVLVGAQNQGTADVVTTPFGTDVPGVHLHAQALDNMLTFGPAAYVFKDEGHGGVPAPLILILLLLAPNILWQMIGKTSRAWNDKQTGKWWTLASGNATRIAPVARRASTPFVWVARRIAPRLPWAAACGWLTVATLGLGGVQASAVVVLILFAEPLIEFMGAITNGHEEHG